MKVYELFILTEAEQEDVCSSSGLFISLDALTRYTESYKFKQLLEAYEESNIRYIGWHSFEHLVKS